MSIDYKILQDAIMSGDNRRVADICQQYGYTEADISKAMAGMGRKLRLALQARGEIEKMDDIEKLIGDDGY